VNNFTELNLHSNICKAISICGYTKPTPVQSKSIPEILEGRDVVVSAQTGTGKTAAFVLPALHNLSSKEPSKKTRVLILTPTRELASQITKAASMYGKFMNFKIVSLVGGMPYHGQIKDLARGADIIVATPGRLMDHIEQKRVDISHIEMLVLDEADRMLDMGFIDDVQYIAKLTPTKRQTLLFSATLDNKLMNAVKHLLKDPVRINLSSEKIASPQIKQEMYKANSPQHKTRLLKHFLKDENIYKAIIFSATKINADKLADQLCDDGFAAAALHGDLRQNVRNRTLEQLRRGKIQFLVATDVAARGIDVSDITHVFNYDLPRFCEDYVHRIGRTGRAGKTGIAISFVLPTDRRHVQSIERFTGQRIQLIQDVAISDSPSSKKSYEKNEHDAQAIVSASHDAWLDDDKPRKKQGTFKKGGKFKSERGDRGERGFKSERGERSERGFKSERGERSERGFKSERGDRSERGFKSERGDRSERGFKSERGERSERGFKSERGDRSERSFKSERGERSERGFKSERGERSERSFKSERGDRSERGFKSDRGDRSERGFKSDRGERSERGFKSERGDRSERGFKSERGERSERSFKSERGDRSERGFKSERGDKKDRISFNDGYRSKSKLSSNKLESWFSDDIRAKKSSDEDARRTKFSGDSDKRGAKKSGEFKHRSDKSASGESKPSFKKRSGNKEGRFSEGRGRSSKAKVRFKG